MKKSDLLNYDNELAYALERFEDENDRKPTEAELATIKEEVQSKVDEMQEAYNEYVASGAFECAVCEKTHYHHAPRACCNAYASGMF